jgi:hypothetical protein
MKIGRAQTLLEHLPEAKKTKRILANHAAASGLSRATSGNRIGTGIGNPAELTGVQASQGGFLK